MISKMSIPRPSPLLGLFLLVLGLESFVEVSAWVPAVRNRLARTTVIPHPRDVVTAIQSTIEDATETLTEALLTNTQRQKITVPMPKIQYTVPGMNLGWRENGVWMDKDGPRNGPPANYWRQAADERKHTNDLDLIRDLLQLNNFDTNSNGNSTSVSYDADIVRNEILNERVTTLEKMNSMRIPCLNRQILGDWAPILRGEKVLCTSTPDAESSVDIPYRFHIERTDGLKLAPETRYGTFDEHIEPGEKLTVEEVSNLNAVSSTGIFTAISDRTELKLVEGYTNAVDGDLYVGGITYLTKYVMIMRRPAQEQEVGEKNKGSITEIWMKIDSK
jgi:hypothetical protein